MGGGRFYVDFTLFLSVFWMDMNDVNLFICYYNTSVVVLPKCISLAKISLGIFGKVLNVKNFTFMGTKFTKDLIWCLS